MSTSYGRLDGVVRMRPKWARVVIYGVTSQSSLLIELREWASFNKTTLSVAAK